MSETQGAASESGTDAARRRVVGSRYELGDEIGRGGASVVHTALDLATGEPVAVKFLRAGVANDALRVSREVGALQHLRLPGVVTLRDVGVHDGLTFLVMDLVEGEPFPGCPTPIAWTALAPVAVALLETLGRVHAAGVVHRDLKPSNVLVSPSGHVTILDFGVSWGPALGEAVTVQGAVVGTLEYLAPEQFKGHRGDPRSDLYAVGTMLYEALAGRLPHVATDIGNLIHQKLYTAPSPLRSRVPDAPRAVAQLIGVLLSADPADRPATAGWVLADLRGEDSARGAVDELPWLGDETLVVSLTQAALAARVADLYGAPGSGRTRLLVSVADRLEAHGRHVRWLPEGSAPYESLEGVVGPLTDLRADSHADAERQIRDHVARRLEAGDAILVDGVSRIDRWSARALDRCIGQGAVVRVVDEPCEEGVHIRPLDEVSLRPLFAGPERIFHLRTDCARELWRRTGGHQGRVAAEVAAWVRAGFATWRDGRLHVSMEALHRLRGGLPVSDELFFRHGAPAACSAEEGSLLSWLALAWPSSTTPLIARVSGIPHWQIQPMVETLADQGLVRRLDDGRVEPLVAPHALEGWTPGELRRAHRALADALEPGDPSRFGHVVAAGDDAEIVAEAQARARSLEKEGFAGDALAVIEQGLVAARSAEDRAAETRLLCEMANVGLDDGSRAALQRVLYEIGRATERSELLACVEALLRAAREGDTGDAEATLQALDGMPAFEHWQLELWRHGQRFRCAMRLSEERRAAVLEELGAWAESVTEPGARASHAAWRALHTWKSGDPLTAGQLSLDAISEDRPVSGRLANLMNAAMAFLEAGALERAEDAARRARDAAAACRAPLFEAHAESVMRSVAYRLGRLDAVDDAYLDSIAMLGDPVLEGAVLLTEAATEWRAGRLERARALARRTAEACVRAGAEDWSVVARALAAVCGGARDAGATKRLLRDAEACQEGEAAVQALGLLAIAAPDHAARLRSLARARAESLMPRDTAARGDVLSIDECLNGLRP